MKQSINQKVAVTAVGFKKDMTAYPRRIEFDGKTYRFIDAGLSCVIRRGERAWRIVTMSDGVQQFQLRHDTKGQGWTLLSTST